MSELCVVKGCPNPAFALWEDPTNPTVWYTLCRFHIEKNEQMVGTGHLEPLPTSNT